MSADTAAPRPTGDYSKGRSPLWPVLIGGLAGGALLIAADLSTLIQIKVLTVVQDRVSGHGQHDWGVAVLGAVACVLALGAGLRRARPALFGLVLVGAAVLGIALFKDLPDSRSTGVIGRQYEDAVAQRATGFYLETAGGVLLLLTGGLGLLAPRPAPRRRSPRTPGHPAAAPE